MNDVYVKLARIRGDKIPLHKHREEDELFYVLEGELFMEVEGEAGFVMKAGDIYVVKKGKEHRISSKEECRIMLIENKTTAHTGEVKTDITRSIEEQM
ncbi:MAG: cupin domain-containing protein [Bacteroides sp.]|nr:cupin domain-containing protein [Bacteroides sp.]